MQEKHPRERSSKRLVAWLTSAGLVIVSLLALFTVVLPLVLGAQSYTVLTGSMKPALEPGYLIGVRSTPIAEVNVGDIVTFQLESGKPTVATHRVVSVGFDGTGDRLLVTQGDANNIADAEPVREVQLRGVVVYAVPWLGYINAWATPAIKSTLVAVIGLAAITWGVITLGGDLLRRKRSARYSAVAILVLIVASVPVFDAERAFAVDSSTELVVQMSTDGIHWVKDGNLTLFQSDELVVPGDSVRAPLQIRNGSHDTAELQLSAAWQPTDLHSAADSSLAEQLEVHLSAGLMEQGGNWHGGELPPGGVRDIDVVATLPWHANDDARNGAAFLTVNVTLTESRQETVDAELAATGQSTSVLPWLLGSAGIAAGALLALGGVRRRRRSEAPCLRSHF